MNHSGEEQFAVSLWRWVDGVVLKSLGKSYELGLDGSLIKSASHLFSNETRVVRFGDLKGLAAILSSQDAAGCFVTAGLPEDWQKPHNWRRVTRKNEPATSESVQRTKDYIKFRQFGGMFVLDFDPDWFVQRYPDRALPTPESTRLVIVEICRDHGLNVTELAWLCYKSSSSSLVRISDSFRFDKGGFHLIALVDDASDIERFRDALTTYLASEGTAWGGVSKSGDFLERGLLDTAAIRPTQPIFMLPANHGEGLRVDRELRFLGGDQRNFDSRALSSPSSSENLRAKEFWRKERDLLGGDLEQARAEWKAKSRTLLKEQSPYLTAERIEKILDRQTRGLLLGDVEIHFDEFGAVKVSSILGNLQRYDEATCADPLEPDYGSGVDVAIVYTNIGRDRPVLYSHAHGGRSYFLMFDLEAALEALTSAKTKDYELVNRILECTYTANDVEMSLLFREVKKHTGIGVTHLRSTYKNVLLRNRQSPSRPGDTETYVNSIEYKAAQEWAERETISCSNGGLWRYDSTHWRPLSDAEAASELLRILEPRWAMAKGKITSAVKLAVESLKQQTFTSDPPYLREPHPVINCRNGELRFNKDGTFELMPHSPASGITTAPVTCYDLDALAERFSLALEEMFTPSSRELMEHEDRDFEKAAASARDMARHMEEVLAYLLVPDRWQAVWFLFLGGGANGKSKLIEVLQMLIPEECVISERLKNIADNQHGMARLIGKTLYVDDDLQTGIVLPDDFLKQISEGKLLSANVKHRPTDTVFYNRCGVVLLSNNYPKLVDTSVGTRRRTHVIEFPRRFLLPHELSDLSPQERILRRQDAADPNLVETLRGELSGILNVLIKAYSRLRMRGGFEIPDRVKASTQKALLMAYPLMQFIEEECETGADFHVSRTHFRTALLKWCDDQQNRWTPSAMQVRKQLEDLGYDKGRKNQKGDVGEAYFGLKLREQQTVAVGVQRSAGPFQPGARIRR